jgi:penicillin amidase
MINLSRLGRAASLTIGAAAGLAGVSALVALRRPLPRTTGTLPVPGLRSRVQVLRDRWGVPHIYADCNEDLFAALGYVHAQERLWQMEVNRRTGHGQLAELFGPIALSSDRFVRTLGFGRLARRDVERIDDDTRTTLEAYVRGINAFVEFSRSPLPLEFTLLRHTPRPWEAADVLVWARVMALSLNSNWTTALLNARIVAAVGEERARELMPRYPETHPITVPAGIHYNHNIGAGALRAAAAAAPFLNQAISGHGSNGWVVSGERSISGKPLLANDTHLGLTIPGVWFEAHLVGGDYRVAGFTFPGVPGVVIGHNERIAWGTTNSMTSDHDIYIERFRADNPLRYEWCGAWEEAELVGEEITVKGQKRGEAPFSSVTEEVRVTRHGPVISAITGPDESPLRYSSPAARTADPQGNGVDAPPVVEELALRWNALDTARIVQSVLQINRARDWDEFRAALADWNSPAQNFVYADVDGHYGHALGGNIPIRAKGDGRLPVPGWTGEYEWQGYIPTAALPATYDPPEGLAVTANNRIAGAAYVYGGTLHGDWLNGYRAARIRQLLDYTFRHNAESFARIHTDVLSLPGIELARLLADLSLTDPIETQARDLLATWDGDLTTECVGGTIYAALRYHLERRTYAELGDLIKAQTGLGVFGGIPSRDYLGRAFPNIVARIAAAEGPERRDPWLGAGRTWNSVLQESFALAVAELRASLGNDPATWNYSRVHSLTLRHTLGSAPALAPIFNRGPWPTGGDMDTVCMGYLPRDSAVGPVYIAPSQRQICDTGDWDNSLSVLPAGQSGHPGSLQYNDMAASWRNGGYHPMLWSRARVEEHTVARLSLMPV